jgi:type II secretory pathway pseudopilin PulG
MKGFTLIEVLTVVAIMMILFSMVVVAVSTIRRRMNRKATVALIHRLRLGLEEYKQITGSYPPDGYDKEVTNDDGEKIWGAACLYYFLTKELTEKSEVSGQIRTRKHEPVMKFSERELSLEFEDMPGVREVVDGFGLPFHYDNTENGVFAPINQENTAHMIPVDFHPPDPRTSEDPSVVPKPGIQSIGYDLWSHGTKTAHEDDQVDLTLTLASWNVDVEQTDRAGAGKEGKR